MRILTVVFDVFFKISSDQPIRFSWFQPNSVDNLAILSSLPSRAVTAVSPTPGYSPVAEIAADTISLALTTKMSPQAVAGTSSALVIVPSSIQAVFSPDRAAFSPTRTVISVSTRSGRKCPRNEV